MFGHVQCTYTEMATLCFTQFSKGSNILSTEIFCWDYMLWLCFTAHAHNWWYWDISTSGSKSVIVVDFMSKKVNFGN